MEVVVLRISAAIVYGYAHVGAFLVLVTAETRKKTIPSKENNNQLIEKVA